MRSSSTALTVDLAIIMAGTPSTKAFWLDKQQFIKYRLQIGHCKTEDSAEEVWNSCTEGLGATTILAYFIWVVCVLVDLIDVVFIINA